MTRAYYNEHDSFAAEWLKMLIVAGLIAEGDVDTRSIEDVTSSDIAGYTQVHLFAGIGGWSRALRLSGWPDCRSCWTCSCPCQPFSAAGKGGGFADERHLWPAAHWLIAQRRPVAIFGEQVASKDGLAWFDTVSTDLENTAYSAGAVDICAAGIGAPHIRQRLYWRADSMFAGWSKRRSVAGGRSTAGSGGFEWSSDSRYSQVRRSDGAQDRRWGNSETGRLRDVGVDNNSFSKRWDAWGNNDSQHDRQLSSATSLSPDANVPSEYGRSSGREQSLCEQYYERSDSISEGLQGHSGHERNWGKPGWLSEEQTRSVTEAGATRGFWRDADWWHGRDEKYRPIEPGIFPLASGVSGRMGKLRGYGNSIVAPLAAAFIEATEEVF